MSRAIRRVTIDLTNVQSIPQEIASPDMQIGEFVITRVPPGAIFRLHWGKDGDFMEIDGKIAFRPTGSIRKGGLYWTNAVAQAGVIIYGYVMPPDSQVDTLAF